MPLLQKVQFSVGSTPTNISPDTLEKRKVRINTNIVSYVYDFKSLINLILCITYICKSKNFELYNNFLSIEIKPKFVIHFFVCYQNNLVTSLII